MPAKQPQDIRNIVLLGHGGSGKTILAEAMLHAAKVTTRFGKIEDGTTALDYQDLEKKSGHSVDPAGAHFSYGGKDINVIDTPGYPDFIGGAISGMSGADIALVVVSASAGIEVNTRKLFNLAGEQKMARAIVINKMDAEAVDLPVLLKALTDTFGQSVRCFNLPLEGHKKVIDCLVNTSGSAEFDDVGTTHTQLVESIIEVDEKLMERYLGGEEIQPAQVASAIAKAMVTGTVVPVFFTVARDSIGVPELMDAIAKYFPSPLEMPVRAVRTDEAADAELLPLACDPSKPFVGQAFRIAADPFVGKLSWVRIIQGSLTPETTFQVRDHRKGGKVGHLFKLQGKDTVEIHAAVAGDIVALPKIEDVEAGDILHTDAKGLYGVMPPVPTPMYSLAVTPKSRGDETKISEALTRLTEEDLTFKVTRDAQTSETVVSGIGDLHLRVMLEKMATRFNMHVDTKPPKIPYRESITMKADGHYRHKKQTGGAGQFGEVYLRVEPNERGKGYEFTEELFGESIPRQYVPAIEKGVKEVIEHGAVAGYPLQDLRVIVTDGKYHPVDSKEVAFRTAGKFAVIDAIHKAKPVILEPVVILEITVPAQYMGDIAGDLSGRRGRILGQEMLPGNYITIKAQAPLAEVMQYNNQLRSVTGGQGSYQMELSHYDPVPGNVQQQIIANAAKAKEEEKE